MYEVGELVLVTHEYSDECYEHYDREGCSVIDSRTDGYGYDHAPIGTVYLPHSCGKWVIGGPDQIRALIADLQAALAANDKSRGARG